MLPFIASLAGVGIDFIGDMIKEHGEDLVVKGVKKVVGVDISKKSLTKEDIKAIRQAEKELKELDFKELELHQKDRNSARDMQKEALNQEDTFSKRFIYYYASFITIATFAYIFFITFREIPTENVRFADTVLGFLLGTGLSAIINFFYGSSKGSADKTEALNSELLKKGNDAK